MSPVATLIELGFLVRFFFLVGLDADFPLFLATSLDGLVTCLVLGFLVVGDSS